MQYQFAQEFIKYACYTAKLLWMPKLCEYWTITKSMGCKASITSVSMRKQINSLDYGVDNADDFNFL